MNRSYSKIRHIQESNLKLENRLITEDKDDLFLKRRYSTIEDLIEKYVNEVEEEETLFSDEFEFADNIISWVVQDLTTSNYSDHNYDELTDLIKDNFGEYILSQYTEVEDEFGLPSDDYKDRSMYNPYYGDDDELEPADDNEYLENLQDIFQMYAKNYSKNSEDFDNMVDTFYKGYEDVINNMTDGDKDKFERFMEVVYSELPTHEKNNSMNTQHEFGDEDDY